MPFDVYAALNALVRAEAARSAPATPAAAAAEPAESAAGPETGLVGGAPSPADTDPAAGAAIALDGDEATPSAATP
ncbi:hypothetical protein [Embleya sp. NBC_00896]|uniref:hypothetical protein n=1 Tax=Embleya sp. NBC_00896 TaxID=2975961 RepID=UPI002F9199CF|nr:hypothetical protein OG928_36475 [Embleya sp. NBC_00896]